ncbi:MAG: hypothetical protein EBU08_11430 [Micrococcales bacterium]|nr:hypothetical protein [Microbacteriaceae bacterium]NBR24357.1 hypothetical protein [Micrococcales bacterium]NBS60620.1 hypothetical protein [Microbacteriaceae bacterium]
MNRQIKRTLGTVAALSLGLAGFVGAVAPAHAAASTTFKIHLNVPKSVAQDWNLWHWGTAVASINNTIGVSTQTIEGASWTGDSTPNFVGEDAYGAYAEFTLPVSVTALNNVMRTTESWDGQAAVEAVEDDPSTPDTDETVAAKAAIPAADKPFGGDNIFPAGESWWNVGTQKREYPEVREYKVHLNTTLKLAQSQGWNIYSWNTTVAPSKLADYAVTTVTTKKVGKKTVKVTTKTNPYKGKVGATVTGWPFVGEDKYGAYAIVKTMAVYAENAGMVLRRSTPTNEWAGVQSADYKKDNNNNGLTPNITDLYLAFGTAETYTKVPTFVGRYGATATYANGNITVTPVRPAAASLKGMFPTKIEVKAIKGATVKTCTIESKATTAVHANASFGLPESCDIAVTAPAAGDDAQTWNIFVQASAFGVGTGPGATDKANAKVTISAPQN